MSGKEEVFKEEPEVRHACDTWATGKVTSWGQGSRGKAGRQNLKLNLPTLQPLHSPGTSWGYTHLFDSYPQALRTLDTPWVSSSLLDGPAQQPPEAPPSLHGPPP